jgi:hypothetical protein
MFIYLEYLAGHDRFETPILTTLVNFFAVPVRAGRERPGFERTRVTAVKFCDIQI